MTLHEWMAEMSRAIRRTESILLRSNWTAGQFHLRNGRYVCCGQTAMCGYIPYGTGLEIAVWVSVAVSIASTAYALFFAPKPELGGFSSIQHHWT
jgi:hypothetical protein